MDIPEINALPTAIEMRKEVIKLAIEKNVSEEDIWQEIDIYRKTHPQGKIQTNQSSVKSLIVKILAKTKIHIVESPIEAILKQAFERRHIDFETQKKIGKHRVDFFFPQGRLVVEADGNEYHSTEEQRTRDMERQCKIMQRGYVVLRFRGSQIFKDVEICVDKISKFLDVDNKK